MAGEPEQTSAYVLDAGEIVKTIERLHGRIEARFPGSGLGKVCADLARTAGATDQRIRKLAQPFYWLRLAVMLVVVAAIAAQLYVARLIDWADVIHKANPVGVTEGLDAAMNLLALAFGAIWFLVTAEVRLKRRLVLARLHELRSMAHVIDMHQLTKGPSVDGGLASETPASGEAPMNDFELSRYLDYCTEMLALTGKLAALYAGGIKDPEVISAVNEIERHTTDLGRKIWQKIMLIGDAAKRPPERCVAQPAPVRIPVA